MKSKIFTRIMTVAAGAALLAGAALPAQAATREFNIYGASAQYLFWNALAPSFLTSPQGGGCSTSTPPVQAQFNVAGSSENNKHGMTLGYNCGNFGGDDILIRYSSKASYDGIYAVQGTAGDTCTAGQRRMADEATRNGAVITGRKCVPVHVGASDVAGESFTQSSFGRLIGANGLPGTEVNRTFNGINTDGLAYRNPVVVPFGFFANNSVTIRRCEDTARGITSRTNSNPAVSMYAGEQCSADTQCGQYIISYTETPVGSNNWVPNYGGNYTCLAPVVLDNITREMAVQIYSGNAFSWTDFGAGFPAIPIVACMRHAGSGTHATLDYAVVKGNGWGGSLWLAESAEAPTVWFNDGSGDEMNCVNGTTQNGPADYNWGAIGYADADQSVAAFTRSHALKYNGLYGTRRNIRNGLYDFFSNQWMYTAAPEGSATRNLFNSMMDYASSPANIPASKAKYWATANEMNFQKSTDRAYPTYVGATDPQTP